MDPTEEWPVLDADGERLVAAIGAADLDAMVAILDRRPDLLRAPIGLLHRCVADNQLAPAKLLVERGVDVDERNPSGRRALHDSLEYGRRALAEYLVASGATVDAACAALVGDVARLEALATEDPEALADETTGLSVLGWASYGGHPEVVDVLVRYGIELDVEDGLFPAAQCDHHRFVEAIIANGVDPSGTAGPSRSTALHVAVQLAFTDHATRTVRVLVESGADPTIRDARGRTPLDVARIAEAAAISPRKDFAALIALLEGA